MPLQPDHEPFRFDTNPGSGSPFAPRTGFCGDANDYREALLDRYRHDPEARQQMLMAARALKPGTDCPGVVFTGLWAYPAKSALLKMHYWLKGEPPA